MLFLVSTLTSPWGGEVSFSHHFKICLLFLIRTLIWSLFFPSPLMCTLKFSFLTALILAFKDFCSSHSPSYSKGQSLCPVLVTQTPTLSARWLL